MNFKDLPNIANKSKYTVFELNRLINSGRIKFAASKPITDKQKSKIILTILKNFSVTPIIAISEKNGNLTICSSWLKCVISFLNNEFELENTTFDDLEGLKFSGIDLYLQNKIEDYVVNLDIVLDKYFPILLDVVINVENNIVG